MQRSKLILLVTVLLCSVAGCDDDSGGNAAASGTDDTSADASRTDGRGSTDSNDASADHDRDAATFTEVDAEGSPLSVGCPDSLGAVPAGVAEAICTKRQECCQSDYGECIVEVAEALRSFFVDVDQAEQEGTASLDCDAYEACTTAIIEADCEHWPAQVGAVGELPVDEPACFDVVRPALLAGESCSYTYECVAGFCSSEDGQCHAFAEENAACGAGADQLCHLPMMFCNSAGRCQRRLSVGVTCSEDGECMSGICNVSASECITPGADQCAYVPMAPANCALHHPGMRSSPLSLLGFLLVLWLARVRR